MSTLRRTLIICPLALAVAATPAWAQPKAAKARRAAQQSKTAAEAARKSPEATEEEKLLAETLKLVDDVDKELVRLGARKKHVPAADRKRVHIAPDTMAMGTIWDGRTPDGQRIFAAQLKIANLAEKEATVRRADVRLTADDQTFKLEELSQQVRNQGLQVGNQYHNLGNLLMPESVAIPPGAAKSVWMVFAGLPQTADTPDLKLALEVADEAVTIDLNEFARGMLGLNVERIGPRKALGLITIGGTLNAVNAGALVEALDKLTLGTEDKRDKVARVVIRWDGEKPAPVDAQVLGWLQQAADRAGQASTNDGQMFHLPTVPVSIRELHLARVPEGQANYYGANAATRIHKTDAEAAAAALQTALDSLPADELLAEIEKGHPLTRAAALAAAGRLPAEHLPVVLRHVDSADETLRRAAIAALGQFGEPAAVERLVAIVRKGEPPWAGAAIESLAASRFAAGQRALHAWLQEDPARITQEVVDVLARYPHPLWAETVYAFVRKTDKPLGIAALRALVAVGHPEITDLLERALKEGDDAVKREVFGILLQRDDDRSEQLATNYAVEHLGKGGTFDGEIMQFLNRTRDPRILEPLLEMLRKGDEKNAGNRQMVIHTLSQIGDQRAAEILLEIYPKLQPHEKGAALNTLQQLQSSRFRELAGEAIGSNDQGLVSQAAQGLANEGSEESMRLLIDAFETTKDENSWNYIANALGSVGTPAAREALRKARDSSNANRRQYAINALNNLKHRSAGFQYLNQGMESIRQGDLDRALKQFNVIIKMDEQLPDGYAYRGSLLLNAGKTDEARKDFETALRLDPYSVHGTAGLAMLTIRDGKPAEGVGMLEDAREKFQNIDGSQLNYRLAAVYGQAMRQVRKDETIEDRETKAAEYQKKAMELLQEAVRQNTFDQEFIKHDPDLKPLAELPEFKNVVGQAGDFGPRGNFGLQVVDVAVE